MDKYTSKAIDEVSKNILILTEDSFKKNWQRSSTKLSRKSSNIIKYCCSRYFALFFVGISISRKVFKYLGNEPEELNEYFSKTWLMVTC